MREVGLGKVEFLPFNPSSAAKYEWLGLPYEIPGEPQEPSRLADIVAMAREAGLEATTA